MNLLTPLGSFGRFWWNFVVGDDWRAAAGVVAAIGVTAAIASDGVPAWWFLPLAVAAVLWLSLRREARASRAKSFRSSLE